MDPRVQTADGVEEPVIGVDAEFLKIRENALDLSEARTTLARQTCDRLQPLGMRLNLAAETFGPASQHRDGFGPRE